MAAVNGQVATSGLVGALTSVFVGVANSVVPDGNLKSLLAIMAGMAASIVSFEILAFVAVFRLNRQQKALEKLIPTLAALQSSVQDGITKQVELMHQHKAPAASIKEVEKAITDGATDIAKALAEIQKRSIDIVKEISR